MKNIFLFFLIGAVSISIAQENGSKQNFDQMVRSYYKNSVPLIYPHQLYKKMVAKEDFYLLDTRETEEFKVSSLKNAIHVGYDHFLLETVKNIDKNASIIVYCTIGARSENIGEKLKKNGFTNIHNLYGGLIHWKNEGYKVFSGHLETYNIHVYSKKWGKWLNVGNPVY